MLATIVGHNIKSRRLQSQWTIECLAGQCGLDPAHVGRIERGQHNATLTTISRIARVLCCRPHQLFADDNGTDYGIVCLFMMNNFFQPIAQNAIYYFDELSFIVRSKLTIQDVEQGAYAANVEFYVTERESPICPNVVTYGLMAAYVQTHGRNYSMFPDISLHREVVVHLFNQLNRLRPSVLHLEDVVADYIQTL